MKIDLIDTIDRAGELAAMLSAVRFDELTAAGSQGVHTAIALLTAHLDTARELAALE